MDLEIDDYYIDRPAPRDRLEVVDVPADATEQQLVDVLVGQGLARGEAETMVREQLARNQAASTTS